MQDEEKQEAELKKRLQKERADWEALVEFMRYLPPHKYRAFSNAIKRVRTNEVENSLEDLAQSNLALDQYRRIKLQSDTFFSIINKMMGLVKGTGLEEQFIPIIDELRRFIKEMDAPDMTTDEAKRIAIEKAEQLIGSKVVIG